MLPEAVQCEDCGGHARVRACGRIEYDWPNPATDGQLATMPTINSARLTLDCPNCGVKIQDFRPEDPSDKTTAWRAAAPTPPPTMIKRRPFVIRPKHAQ